MMLANKAIATIDMSICEEWEEIWYLQYIADKIDFFGSHHRYIFELKDHLRRFFEVGHESLPTKVKSRYFVDAVYFLKALRIYRLADTSQGLLEGLQEEKLRGSMFDYINLDHLKDGLIDQEVEPNVYVDRLFLHERFKKHIKLNLQELEEVLLKGLTPKNKKRVERLIKRLNDKGINEMFVTHSFPTGLTKDQYFSGYGYEMIDLPEDDWSIWKRCKVGG